MHGQLETSQPLNVKTEYKYIIVSEREEEVKENITSYIQQIDQKKPILKKLKDELPKTIQLRNQKRNQHIQQTQNKVIKLFNDTITASEHRKNTLLSTLQNIKQTNENDTVSNECKHNENDQMTDMKYINDANIKLEAIELYLRSQLQQCNDKIHSVGNDNKTLRKQRETNVIKIGKETKQEFDRLHSNLTNIMTSIENVIAKNKSMIFDIDYIYNETEYKRLMNEIKNFGTLINETYDNTSQQKQKQKPYQIKKEQHKIIKKKDTVQLLQQQIDGLKLQCNTLQQQEKKLVAKHDKAIQQKNAQIQQLRDEIKSKSFSRNILKMFNDLKLNPKYKPYFDTMNDWKFMLFLCVHVYWYISLEYKNLTYCHKNTSNSAELKEFLFLYLVPWCWVIIVCCFMFAAEVYLHVRIIVALGLYGYWFFVLIESDLRLCFICLDNFQSMQIIVYILDLVFMVCATTFIASKMKNWLLLALSIQCAIQWNVMQWQDLESICGRERVNIHCSPKLWMYFWMAIITHFEMPEMLLFG